MRAEFSRCEIQRSILTVKQIGISVKYCVGYRIDRLGILDHGTTILPHLELLHTLDISVSGVLIGDLKRKGIQTVS